MAIELKALGQPLKDGGIRTVNFFNGRLLSGADLSREQEARREADARIGQAMGDGVAAGLEVSFAAAGNGTPPTAQVTAGIAINRLGAALVLPQTVKIALDQVAPPETDAVACLFGDCVPPSGNGHVHGAGLYLLTILPAFTTEGRAQVSGMGDVSGRCAVDATVEGIQFRMLEIQTQTLGFEFSIPDPANTSQSILRPNLRNLVAYACFGDGVTPAWPADLLSQDHRFDDLVERLRGKGLDDAEVPLALFAFGPTGGLLFADMWSVRRPLAIAETAPLFAALAAHRRTEVGRAMFRQFQDEIAQVPDIAQITAPERFAFLPPAGFLPDLAPDDVLAFFGSMTVRGPMHIDASCVEPLLVESFRAPAIDTSSDHAIWYYRIAQTAMNGGEEIAFFASGHLPYRADARFNLSHYDFANYALIP